MRPQKQFLVSDLQLGDKWKQFWSQISFIFKRRWMQIYGGFNGSLKSFEFLWILKIMLKIKFLHNII